MYSIYILIYAHIYIYNPIIKIDKHLIMYIPTYIYIEK